VQYLLEAEAFTESLVLVDWIRVDVKVLSTPPCIFCIEPH
jgi:hypothetical protein